MTLHTDDIVPTEDDHCAALPEDQSAPFLSGPLATQPTWEDVLTELVADPIRKLGTLTTDPAAIENHDFYLWEGPDLNGHGRYAIWHVQHCSNLPDGFRSYIANNHVSPLEFATRHREWAAGIRSASAAYTTVVYAEMDDGTVDDQVGRIQKLVQATGLSPAMVMHSGGKSLHMFWLLSEPMAVSDPTRMRLHNLIAACLASDPAVSSVNRKMRRPWMGARARRTQPVWLWEPSNTIHPGEAISALIDQCEKLGIADAKQACTDMYGARDVYLEAGRRPTPETRIKMLSLAAKIREHRGSKKGERLRSEGRKILRTLQGSRGGRPPGETKARSCGVSRGGYEKLLVQSADWPSGLVPSTRQECPWCRSEVSGSAPPLDVSADGTQATCHRRRKSWRLEVESDLTGVKMIGETPAESPEVTDVPQNLSIDPIIYIDSGGHSENEAANTDIPPSLSEVMDALGTDSRLRALPADDEEVSPHEVLLRAVYRRLGEIPWNDRFVGDLSHQELALRWSCRTTTTSISGTVAATINTPVVTPPSNGLPGRVYTTSATEKNSARITGLRCFSRGCPKCRPLILAATAASCEAVLLTRYGKWKGVLCLGEVHVRLKTIKRWQQQDSDCRAWLRVRLTPTEEVSIFLWKSSEHRPVNSLGEWCASGIPASPVAVGRLLTFNEAAWAEDSTSIHLLTGSQQLTGEIHRLKNYLIDRPPPGKNPNGRWGVRTPLSGDEVVERLKKEYGVRIDVEGSLESTAARQRADISCRLPDGTSIDTGELIERAVEDGVIPVFGPRRTRLPEGMFTFDTDGSE